MLFATMPIWLKILISVVALLGHAGISLKALVKINALKQANESPMHATLALITMGIMALISIFFAIIVWL